MSSNLLVALILLPILGAAIAWAGDVIGYRLGRRRQSLFGLRPRTTARVLAMVVGAVLPLAGLGFAMAVSRDARDAILRIDALRQQADTLSVRNANLLARIERAQSDAQSAREEATLADVARKGAATELSRTQTALGASQTDLGRTRGALAGARSGLSATKSTLAETRKDLTSTRSSLASTRGSLLSTKASLDGMRGELGSVKKRLDGVRTELGGAKAELQSARSELMSSKAELPKMAALERDIALAEEHLGSVEERLAESQQVLDRYRRERQAVLDRQVAFEPGDELVRGIVESQWSAVQLEAILHELLKYASGAAAAHGVSPGANGRSVRVVAPIPPGMAEVSERAILNEVVRRISETEAPDYVVIVRAWDGSYDYQAEPMTVELWVAPNKVVFRAGEEILSVRIDGSQSRGHVFRALWQTARQIRNIASDRGMLASPKTGHYVEVPADELLAALDRVLEIGGPSVVSVVVDKETRVAPREDAPLLVRLQVERAQRR